MTPKSQNIIQALILDNEGLSRWMGKKCGQLRNNFPTVVDIMVIWVKFTQPVHFSLLISTAIIVNKRVWNAVLGCNLKKDKMICLYPRQTIQYNSNPSLCLDQ